jgi:hypothetical protein
MYMSYVCASFLVHFSATLRQMGIDELFQFMQVSTIDPPLSYLYCLLALELYSNHLLCSLKYHDAYHTQNMPTDDWDDREIEILLVVHSY